MFEIICVTNRNLCQRDFLDQMERVSRSGVSSVILREKDLSEAEYEMMAQKILHICQKARIPCALHHFAHVAIRLGADRLHLPLGDLEKNPYLTKMSMIIGVSVHSVDQALRAQSLGANYITAGHIFETDCKKDIPGRGLDFLREVCSAVSIPVYAIGGISKDNFMKIQETGAAGACIMSGFMRCDSPEKLVQSLKVQNSF